MKECAICGSTTLIQKHHIVHGRAKRLSCETPESVIDLCWYHHHGTYGVHGKNGKELDMRLKLQLQANYFSQGKSEDDVRVLMGGKLYLVNGEVFGYVRQRTRPSGGNERYPAAVE